MLCWIKYRTLCYALQNVDLVGCFPLEWHAGRLCPAQRSMLHPKFTLLTHAFRWHFKISLWSVALHQNDSTPWCSSPDWDGVLWVISLSFSFFLHCSLNEPSTDGTICLQYKNMVYFHRVTKFKGHFIICRSSWLIFALSSGFTDFERKQPVKNNCTYSLPVYDFLFLRFPFFVFNWRFIGVFICVFIALSWMWSKTSSVRVKHCRFPTNNVEFVLYGLYRPINQLSAFIWSKHLYIQRLMMSGLLFD